MELTINALQKLIAPIHNSLSDRSCFIFPKRYGEMGDVVNTLNVMCLVRLYLCDSDQYRGRYMYRLIKEKAQELGVRHYALYRGLEGYGQHKRLHTTRFMDLSVSLPIVIEIIDNEENLVRLMAYLEEIEFEGILTHEIVPVYCAKAIPSNDIYKDIV